jgi:cyclic beta-1,2-glucan synthetase
MDWREFHIEYRHGRSRYTIAVLNPDAIEGGVVETRLDGRPLPPSSTIELVDDGRDHAVEVRRTAPRPTRARAGS